MNFSKIIVKYRHGLIATLLLHALLFVYLSNTHIKDYNVATPNEEILAEFDFTQEEPDFSEQNNGETSTELINAAANASQKQSTYTNSFNKSDLDQSIEDELKNLENQFFDELKEGREEVKEIKEAKNNNSSVIDKNAKENEKASLGADVSATASFVLKDRYDLALPVPSYICRKEGVVTVNIKVNQKGDVKSVSVNPKGTNTTNECLIENALNYAKKARFNQKFDAEASQSGSIKFVFSRQ